MESDPELKYKQRDEYKCACTYVVGNLCAGFGF